MNAAVLLLALAVLSTLGCGSGPSDPSAAPGASSEEISIDASSTTQSDIGVVRWTMQRNNPDAPLKGLDADDRTVVEFDENGEVTNGRRVDTFVWKQGGGFARMVVAIEDTNVTLLKSSFAGKYVRTAQHIAEDLQSAAPASSGTPLLATAFGGGSPKTLRPQSLVSECAMLVSLCGWLPVGKYEADNTIAQYCSVGDKPPVVCNWSTPPNPECLQKAWKVCEPALQRKAAAERDEPYCNQHAGELKTCDMTCYPRGNADCSRSSH
jgi:hypothetical protein